MREKVQGLESALALKENELRQAQIAHSEAESIAIESLSSRSSARPNSGSIVKDEPVDPAVSFCTHTFYGIFSYFIL